MKLAELIQTKDWSNTVLGRREDWPESLKLAVNICLNSGFPIALYWGKEFTLIYNDAWSSIPGDKHPMALGKPGPEVWPEIWDGLAPEFNSVLNLGESIRQPDALLLMNRYGYVEECYFDYTLSPIMDANNQIGGVFNVVIETTYRVINERRKQLLYQLLMANLSRTTADSLLNIEMLIGAATEDIPFSLLFTFSENYKIRGQISLFTGTVTKEIIKAKWPIPELKEGNNSVYVDDISQFVEQLPVNVRGEVCREVCVVPVNTSNAKVSGYMVIGVSPRKRLDDDYKHFLDSVGLHIGNILNNSFAFEQEGLFDYEQALNEQLAVANEELRSTNEELQQAQENLSTLNNDLERRVAYRTKALVESENRLQSMVMTSPVGIGVFKGRNLKIEIVNQPMLEMWSRTRDQVIGKEFVEVFPEQIDQPFLDLFEQVYDTGKSISISEIEVVISTTDGNKRMYVDFQYSPLYDAEKNIEAIMASVINITPIVESRKLLEQSQQEQQALNEELSATNEELAVSMEELAISERKKDEFISIASHELKTPLTSIKAFNQLMQRSQDPERMKNFISKSSEQVHRLEMLIRDLLDVTKINAGKMHYNMEPFNFAAMVSGSIESVQHTTTTHEIILENNEQISYTGDQLRLEQVVQNFLSNAIKYSPQGKKVIVNSRIELDNIVVSVQDFGIGIAENNLDRLFDRYYRVDNTAMQFEGLGLGLFISSEILKRHEGSFWIESEPGNGANFFFRLPLHTDELISKKVKTDTYYQDEHIAITYNSAAKMLEVDWTGYQNMETVKRGGMLMLEMLEKNKCTKVLNDNTHVLGSWSEAADWAGNEWFPMMERAGLKYFAWVYSPSVFSRLAAKRSVDIAIGDVVTQFFTDTVLAGQWLDGR
ncbi:PAS domain S-box-containing protein [Pedobacter sp. UYP24]